MAQSFHVKVKIEFLYKFFCFLLKIAHIVIKNLGKKVIFTISYHKKLKIFTLFKKSLKKLPKIWDIKLSLLFLMIKNRKIAICPHTWKNCPTTASTKCSHCKLQFGTSLVCKIKNAVWTDWPLNPKWVIKVRNNNFLIKLAQNIWCFWKYFEFT